MKKQTRIPGTSGAHKVEVRGKDVFVLEGRNCGKKGCKRCPHGPYWYRLSGSKRLYIGKELTTEAIDRAIARS